MSMQKLMFLLIVILMPSFTSAQIPKGHFLDADSSGNNGYKIKPFIQKDLGIYHYAVLSELPFENNCPKKLSQKKKIECAEDTLSLQLMQNIEGEIDYVGSVYIYFTLTKDQTVKDISVKSYPESQEINGMVSNAVKRLNLKPAIYKNDIVTSRLWTYLKFE